MARSPCASGSEVGQRHVVAAEVALVDKRRVGRGVRGGRGVLGGAARALGVDGGGGGRVDGRHIRRLATRAAREARDVARADVLDFVVRQPGGEHRLACRGASTSRPPEAIRAPPTSHPTASVREERAEEGDERVVRPRVGRRAELDDERRDDRERVAHLQQRARKRRLARHHVERGRAAARAQRRRREGGAADVDAAQRAAPLAQHDREARAPPARLPRARSVRAADAGGLRRGGSPSTRAA